MTDDVTAIPTGVGRELGQQARETVDTPIEEFLDVGVISWYPPYGAQVDAIRSALPRATFAAWSDTAGVLLAERPDARDAVNPAPWRSALRFFGLLAGATAIAGVVVGLGYSRGSTPPLPASATAVVTAIAALVAVASLGGSLIAPSRMGRPSRLVHGVVWMSAIGALGSAAVLPLRLSTWDGTTPTWWSVTLAAGIVLLVLAVVVSVWRRRRSGPPPIDDDEVGRLRVSVVQKELDRSVAEVERLWSGVDAAIRDAMMRERDVALDVVRERLPGALDDEWVRSAVPGTMMLPHAADLAHSALHAGSAALVDREAGGPHGHFVVRARRDPR